jgi:hypothetical protein
MEAFGVVAVRAAKLVRSRACDSPSAAWESAAEAVFSHSESLRDKNCPRGAFLGLCAEGLVAGVPAGDYTRSRDNRGYAVRAARLLAAEPGLAGEGPQALWDRVQGGATKAHNSQMDVVLALHRHGLLARE